MNYFKCQTCGAVVTKFGIANHSHKNFLPLVGQELQEQVITKKRAGDELDALDLLIKQPVFISKTDRIVKNRSKGSRVEMQYGRLDIASKTAIPIAKEEFYRLALSNGMVDEKYLHSFYYIRSSDESSITGAFIDKLVSSQTSGDRYFAIVTLYNGQFYFGICSSRSDLIIDPIRIVTNTARMRPYLGASPMNSLRKLFMNQVYGDILSPRNQSFTVILLDAVFEDRSDASIKTEMKFVVFELDNQSDEWNQIIEGCGESFDEIERIAKEVLIG